MRGASLEGAGSCEALDGVAPRLRRKHGGGVSVTEGRSASARHDRPVRNRASGGASGHGLPGPSDDFKEYDTPDRENNRYPGPGTLDIIKDRSKPSKKDGGWIKGAVKHPGVFSAAAKRAGESTHAFAEEHKGDGGTKGKRARLALTFEKMRHRAAGEALHQPKEEDDDTPYLEKAITRRANSDISVDKGMEKKPRNLDKDRRIENNDGNYDEDERDT